MPKVGTPRRAIDRDHLEKLRGSGLSKATIAAAGIYTEHNAWKLTLKLNGSGGGEAVPAMVFPYRDRTGRLTDYACARPSKPRIRASGKVAKYEIPQGRGTRPYFPYGALSAINSPGRMLLITEGILKSLAATQAGVPCIGLMGVWNWVVGKSDPREMIPELAELDWQDRMVAIAFDFDKERKPEVNQAAAEFARVLSEAGADVRILELPPGPLDSDGSPTKQAVDDFIVRYGEPAFRRWIDEQLAEPPARSLADWRDETISWRLDVLGESGTYLDRSPTGAGKSFADGEVLERLGEKGRSLSLQPTHKNCRQVESEFASRGLDAAAFPPLNEETCPRVVEAVAVSKLGISFARILCPRCPFADGCLYREGYNRARKAQHAIACHKRAETQMHELAQAREYIAIHENPLATLRPTYKVDGGLEIVGLIARESVKRSSWTDKPYYKRMSEIARQFNGELEGNNKTAMVPIPEPAPHTPKNVDLTLYATIRNLHGARPVGEAMRLVRSAVDGELDVLWAKADQRRKPGGEIRLVRSLVGVLRTELPAHPTICISDATANQREIEMALGRSVEDRTPKGYLARRRPVLQIPRDVTRETSPSVVADILRGILHDIPYGRVGVISHLPLCEGLRESLGRPYAARVAMVEHFHSGQSRGSNEWIEKCDALIVLGTPRVPPRAIRERLLSLGDGVSGRLDDDDAGWDRDYWSGVTESGRRVTVRTSAYRNHAWHAAYCSMVHSELLQAIGRGRGILDAGVPVYVVTKEPLKLTLADAPFGEPLTMVQRRVLDALYNGRQRCIRSRADIAKAVGVNLPRANTILNELMVAGRVRRIGERRGWVAEIRYTKSYLDTK